MSTAAQSHTDSIQQIEVNVPFASSILWSWMKSYYEEGGVAVWTEGDIPFHITNTPLLATEWAETIFALLRDFHRLGLLDPFHPIEIVELGPGTGRHAYFLLRELERLESLTRVLDPAGYSLTLELAELGSKGLETLSLHPQLRTYLANGRLRLSQFDLATDERPRSWTAQGCDLGSRQPSKNPVFVVANYVLDSLPYEIVRYRKGSAALALATVSVAGLAPGEEPRQLVDLGEKIQLRFSFPEEAVEFPNPDWNRVLGRYGDLQDTHLPVPTGAMTFLERMRGWSDIASVLLVADKSFVELSQLQSLEEPDLVPHGGGFSFNANLHALGYLAEEWGGLSWHTSPRDGTLDLSHLVLPAQGTLFSGPFLEMSYRFGRLEEFHAVDRFRAKESVDDVVTRPKLRLALDLLRLSALDPQVFYEMSDHLLHGLDYEEVDEETEAELKSVLARCLDMVFPVGDEVDMAFEIGRLAYRLEIYQLSERAFRLSLEQFGDDPKTHFNLGLGWFYQQRWSEAEGAFLRALDIDPDYSDAQEWILKTRRRSKARPEHESSLGIVLTSDGADEASALTGD